MDKNILLVDDEKQILRALSRVFMDTDYSVHIAESGEEAFKILKEKKIDLVITDMKMPVMNGYELLKEVKKSYPNVVRIILSGYAEKELIFNSIKENLALYYLYKPWDNQKILDLINKIFLMIESLKVNRLIDTVENPDVYLKSSNNNYKSLIEGINNNEEISELAKIIENDPLLAAKILRFVRSAFSVETGSIEIALNYLNLSDLQSIILTDKISSVIDLNLKYKTNKNTILEQANLTNKIVHLIYEKLLNKKIKNEYRTAGLLSNFGMLVMLNAFSEDYLKILEEFSFKGNTKFIDLERETIGITHQDIGGYLLNLWGLPYPIVETAFYHHTPLDSIIENKELVSVVNIANYYAWKILGIEFNDYEEGVFNFLHIDKNKLEQILILHKLPLKISGN